jgi:5-deoxy-glucuronate isomerase
MRSLLIRGKDVESGEIASVTPNGNDWRYVHFRVLRLRRGTAYAGDTASNEVLLFMIEGMANVQSSCGNWQEVGSRATPFEGAPDAVYLPARSAYELLAVTDCEVAVCGASARNGMHGGRRITLSERDAHVRGSGHAERRIYNVLMDASAADSLFVTEVVTPPGNWSSYPPHKHDVDDPPTESALEEIYYYRAQPSAGFAFQRVYSADGELDETITARDHDVVLVPRGYHVCAAAAEYSIYYLNVLAGPKHVYHMTFDPQHEWIKEGWAW